MTTEVKKPLETSRENQDKDHAKSFDSQSKAKGTSGSFSEDKQGTEKSSDIQKSDSMKKPVTPTA